MMGVDDVGVADDEVERFEDGRAIPVAGHCVEVTVNEERLMVNTLLPRLGMMIEGVSTTTGATISFADSTTVALVPTTKFVACEEVEVVAGGITLDTCSEGLGKTGAGWIFSVEEEQTDVLVVSGLTSIGMLAETSVDDGLVGTKFVASSLFDRSVPLDVGSS